MTHFSRVSIPLAIACLAVVGSRAPAGQVLIDNDSIPDGTGRKVSGVAIANGWSVFQSFDLPAGSWNLTSIGVDGWLVQGPVSTDLHVTICPDDGSGTSADCSAPIAGTVHHLGTDPFASHFTDVPINVTLPGNRRYWCVATPGDDDYWAVLFHASSGEPSYSIRTSDGQRFEAGPTALRIRGQVIAPIPLLSLPGMIGLSLLVVAIAGIALLRRR